MNSFTYEEIQQRHDSRIRVAVAGALSLDISPGFVSGGAVSFGDIIRPGRVTHVEGYAVTPGGPVANTGMALSIFGVEPLFFAKIGNDAFGAMLTEYMEQASGAESVAGIEATSESHTAYSIILAPPGLDRAILQNPGANDFFSASDIDFDMIKKCRHLHFGHPSSMRQMYLNKGEQLLEIIKTARSSGLVTSLDLCAVDPDTEAGEQNWKRILERLLPHVDFFLPSYAELRDIIAPGENPSPEQLASDSASMGAGNVVIKCGEDGMYFRNGSSAVFRDIEKRLAAEENSMGSWDGRAGYVAAKRIPPELVVSGLGAGDTSIAAYIAAMHRGFEFDEVIDLAVSEGALCVTDATALGGLKPF